MPGFPPGFRSGASFYRIWNYPRAAQNAKSAAELQFEKDKAAELDRLESALIPFLQANIIGGGMLKAAEERVTADVVKQGDELYFSDEADED